MTPECTIFLPAEAPWLSHHPLLFTASQPHAQMALPEPHLLANTEMPVLHQAVVSTKRGMNRLSPLTRHLIEPQTQPHSRKCQ